MTKTKNPFKTRSELLAVQYILKQLKTLADKRDKAGFDAKAEQGTYSGGYYEALNDISNKIINKYNLNK